MSGRNQPASEVMLEQLRAQGVRHVFGNPGTTEQPFMDALVDAPDIGYVLGLNEAIVVGAADAYARVTRRPAFVQLHIAAGLGNSIGMLYNAHRGGSPLVVYVGQSPQRALLREPHLSADLVAMAAPVSKWAHEVRRADDVAFALRRAFAVAAAPPPGPAVVSIPIDILEETSSADVIPAPEVDWAMTPPVDALIAASTMLSAAKRPMILVGDRLATEGSPDVPSNAATLIGKLAATIGAPIHQVYPSEIGPDPRDPMYAGTLSFTDPASQAAAFLDIDVLLVVGGPIERVILGGDRSVVPEDTWIVHLDDDLGQIGRHHARTLGLPGSVNRGLALLTERIADSMGSDQAADAERRAIDHRLAIATARGSAQVAETDRRTRAEGSLDFAATAASILHQLPPDGLVFDDAAGGSSDLFRTAAARGRGYFKNRGGGLGAGIPGGVGLALGGGGRHVVAVVSDGSALFTLAGLWTAAHLRLPVVFVILNNRGYQTLVRNMANYLGRNDRPTIGTDLTEPAVDFVAVATGFGLPACQVANRSDLNDALASMFNSSGPGLVEVVLGDPA